MPKTAAKIARQFAVGDRIGDFTIIEGPFPVLKKGSADQTGWTLRHTCGATYPTTSHLLRYSPRKRCSCTALYPEIVRAREYASWKSMKGRCLNPTDPSYGRYGALGITVCLPWQESFEAFYRDMGPRPPNTTLERSDNSKGYDPDNCVWATPVQQARNRARTVRIETADGLRPLSEITEGGPVSHGTVLYRVQQGGWSLERALTTPPRKMRKPQSK